MDADALIEKMRIAGGRYPTPGERFYIVRSEAFQRALRGDTAALARALGDFVDVAGLDPPPTPTHVPRRAVGGARLTIGATERERERASVHAERLCNIMAADPEVRSFRWLRAFAGATLERVTTGVDDAGDWEEVQVHVRPSVRPKPPVLRLRRVPLLLEFGNEAPYARVQPGSFGERLLRLARRIAQTCGWSEAQAVWYLIAGKTPTSAPLFVRVVQTEGADGSPIPESTAIMIMATEHVSAAKVAEVLSKAMTRTRGRPVAGRSDALVDFVKAKTAANGGIRPPWPRLMDEWNNEKPPGWRPFAEHDTMRRTHTRAVERLPATQAPPRATR